MRIRRQAQLWMETSMLRGASALLLAVGLATSAGAGPIDSASLALTLGTLPGASFVATNPTGNLTSASSFTFGGGAPFAGTVTAPVTGGTGISSIVFQIQSNPQGNFTGPSPAAVKAAMPITGVAAVRGFNITLLPVPLTLGSPVTVTAGNITVDIFVTAIGGSWTGGTAAVTGVPFTTTVYAPAYGTFTQMGTTTVTQMGATSYTAGGLLHVQLVAPLKVLTSLAASPVIPSFARLTVSYVPEPGQMAMALLGIAVLVPFGWSRRRRSD